MAKKSIHDLSKPDRERPERVRHRKALSEAGATDEQLEDFERLQDTIEELERLDAALREVDRMDAALRELDRSALPIHPMPKEQIYELPELTQDQQADLLRRAKAAWAATGEPGTLTARSGVEVVDGLGYVVLYGGAGKVLAVYRIRPDNLLLRRLKRWPVGVAGRVD